MPDSKNFSGEIKVASRIIDYLSSGLYQSPAACLKELINNSYDADATDVFVFVKPDADRIIIEDNGTGMDRADFEKHFKKISESHKRDDSDITSLGRPKIGKIGIGFIAANEICDQMDIVSTKSGSQELLEVSINFEVMRQDPDKRRRSKTDFAKADYTGRVDKTDKSSHYTHVFLKKVRRDAKSIMAGVSTTTFTSGKKSLYGLKPSTTCKILQDDTLKSWAAFDAYSKNLLEVALNVPIPYYDDWIPSNLRTDVLDIEKHVKNLNFKLFVDGSEIRKPIVFNPQGKSLISKFKFKGKHVAAEGYFYAQHGTIKPNELQGLLIRIRNAAVGNYDSSFFGFSSSIGPLFQSWISGEIMADDRLEDAMNIDRRTLRISHPAYVELQQAIHKHLDALIKRVRDEIYSTGSQQRNAKRAKQIEERIIDIADRQITNISTSAATKVKKAWKDTRRSRNRDKKLVRKFSVDELYQIVIEVAQKTLSAKQLSEFLNHLTKELQK